jgi:hypothetical protein
LSIQLLFDNDPYSKIYGDKYINKMNYLVKVITEYKNGSDCFHVLNFEAGLGKSFTVDRLMINLINYHFSENDQRFLIVKKFNSESDESVKYLINESVFPEGFALALTHENWSHYRFRSNEIQRFRIIYISHQRYIKLCEDDKAREMLCKGRDTLIIDEKVAFPVYTYNDKRFTTIFNIIPNGLRNKMLLACSPLNEFIEYQRSIKNTTRVFAHTFRLKKAEKEVLKQFSRDIHNAITNNTIPYENRNIIEGFVKELHFFYSNQCVYNSNNISTSNPLHRHWGLENNIILDASAGIDGTYQSNKTTIAFGKRKIKRFNVISQSRIIDHQDCTFNIIKFNSSKSKINEVSNKYFDEITSKILEHKKDNDKVLIVGHKDYAKKVLNILNEIGFHDVWVDKMDKENDEDYEGQSIAIGWYGNLIGKNWAADFTQVWLISTPNIPLEQYLVHYVHYSDDKVGNKSTVVHRGRFKNTYFNEIQTGYIASEMYQSLKRIQRNPQPKGEFFIVCEDETVIQKVLSQIKNANNIIEHELDFVKEEVESKVKEKHKNKKPDQVDMFIQYILSERKGMYKKSEIATKLQISKINRIISDTRVKPLLNKRIRIHTRNIEVI